MKVAVCFFGILRSLEYVIESIQDNIINVLKNNGFDYDVYIHTYESNILPEIDDIYKKLNPKEIVIDDQDEFDEEIKDEPIITECCDLWAYSQENYIRATNSIQKVTEMWENSGINYDIVMLVRPDCMYLKPINLRHIERISINNGIMYVPMFHSNGGYNDRFSMGHPKVMSHFGKQFDEIKKYNNKSKIVAEHFIKHLVLSLRDKGIINRVLRNDFFFLRIRHNKTIAKNDLKALERNSNKQIQHHYNKYKKYLI